MKFNFIIIHNKLNTLKFSDCFLRVFLTVFFGLTISFCLQAQTLQWAKKLGGGSFSETQPASMICDNAGNIYVTGKFSGTVDFDPGVGVYNLTSYGSAYDAYVVKLSSAGNLIFALQFGGAGSVTRGSIIRLDAVGNIYVAGTSTFVADFDPGSAIFNLTSNSFDDIFICKLSSVGNFIWAKHIGGVDYDRPTGLVFDGSGNPVLTGGFSGIVDFDPGSGTNKITAAGSTDVFIWKLDVAGNFVWIKKIGDSNSDEGKSIDTDGFGNLFITGYYMGTVDFDPGVGVFTINNTAVSNMFVLKLDAAGNFNWAKSATNTGGCYPNHIEVSMAGNIYVAGSFTNTVDFDPSPAISNLTAVASEDAFIWKLNSSGALVWCKKIGSTGVDRGIMLFTDDAENLFLTGFFQDNIDLDPGFGVQNKVSKGVYDMFTIKLNAAGNFHFGYAIGGSGYDEGYATAMNPASCNLVVAGSFQQTVDFDPGASSFPLTAGSSASDTYIQQITGISGVCSTPLPVELIDFSAKQSGKIIALKWTTASELNNNLFEVQHSTNGNEFRTFDTVRGAGTSTKVNSYSASHTSPVHGINYFRLNQIDFNGAFAFSKVIAVNFSSSGDLATIYVDESSGTIFLKSKSKETLVVEIISSDGRIISSSQTGNSSEFKIDIQNASKGMYFLRIKSPIAIQKFKLIKK